MVHLSPGRLVRDFRGMKDEGGKETRNAIARREGQVIDAVTALVSGHQTHYRHSTNII